MTESVPPVSPSLPPTDISQNTTEINNLYDNDSDNVNGNNNDNIITKNTKMINIKDDAFLKKLTRIIEDEFNLEILLKQRELQLIENQISKCEAQILTLRNHYSIESNIKLTKEPTNFTEKYIELLTQMEERRKSLELIQQKNLDPNFIGGGGMNGGYKTRRASTYHKYNPNEYDIGEKPSESAYRTRSSTSSLKPATSKYSRLNQCIYRRSDGVLVKLTCNNCQRSNFSSAQGFLNHCRIAHGAEFTSQDNAALICGQVLSDDEQDSEALDTIKKIREDGLDPNKNLAKPQINFLNLGGGSNSISGGDSAGSKSISPVPTVTVTAAGAAGATTTTTTATNTLDSSTPLAPLNIELSSKKDQRTNSNTKTLPGLPLNSHLNTNVNSANMQYPTEFVKNPMNNNNNNDNANIQVTTISPPPVKKQKRSQSMSESVLLNSNTNITTTTTTNTPISKLPTMKPLSHLESKLKSLGKDTKFKELVENVTTKVSKPHLFDDEEEPTEEEILERQKTEIMKQQLINKQKNQQSQQRQITHSNDNSNDNESKESSAATEDANNDEDSKSKDHDDVSESGIGEGDDTKLKTAVKETMGILNEAKKLNLNVDEYLKLALERRKNGDSTSATSATGENFPIPDNKKNKSQANRRRRKSRGGVGIRRNSNVGLAMTSTPTTDIGNNKDSSKTKSISPNTSPSPRNSISNESTGDASGNSTINKEESIIIDNPVSTTSTHTHEDNVSFKQESKATGDEDSDMDIDATSTTITPGGDSSRGHMRTRSMDYKSK
ncbi:hypothetical protein B5S28_g1680 [[Candida] boidinii]|nr:hypothetical protein B5S28_g1680 [[Candida] boidinii]OWB61996.1 hypothetical protein B5S29_g2906 [[Candida] boidinii]